jgi:hypothetical protein
VNTPWRVVVIGIAFLVKFLLGVWLTRSGKPYNALVLTIHKLVSLLTVVLIGFAVHRLWRDVGLSTPQVVAVVVIGLLFLLSIASGGVASTDKPTNAVVLILHRVAPFVTAFATAVTVYLVFWPRS